MRILLVKYILSTIILSIFMTPVTEASERMNVLFIGNSLTYTNNIPKILQKLAQSSDHDLEFGMYAPGGYKFHQHAADKKLQELLQKGVWNIVVLQEQSQNPAFSQKQVRKDVYPYAKQLVRTIRKYNPKVRIIFYMTMARQNGDPGNMRVSKELGTYNGMQNRINRSYLLMAQNNSAELAPVGAVWQSVRKQNKNINLYSDEIHPNRTGSYLAACVFYKTIFDEATWGLPVIKGVAEQDAQFIQSVIDFTKTKY